MGADGGGGQDDDTGRLRAAAGRISPFCSGRSRWCQFFLLWGGSIVSVIVLLKKS
jgi:hypothetical protein